MHGIGVKKQKHYGSQVGESKNLNVCPGKFDPQPIPRELQTVLKTPFTTNIAILQCLAIFANPSIQDSVYRGFQTPWRLACRAGRLARHVHRILCTVV